MTTPSPPPAQVLAAILRATPASMLPGRTGLSGRATFTTDPNQPLLPSMMTEVVSMAQNAFLDANVQTSGYVSTQGLPGAVAASRYVGATVAGAPEEGTFAVGDWVVNQAGKFWICTIAGSSGSWSAGSGSTNTINGVTISGTPAGQVLVSTSSTAASWHPSVGLVPSGDTTGATDSAAISAALTGFPRRKIVLAPGTFYINAPITPPNNAWLQGSGISLTTIVQSATFSGACMWTAGLGNTISDLSLNAPSGTITGNPAGDAILLNANGGFVGTNTINNVMCSNINGYALHTELNGGSYTQISSWNFSNSNCAGGVLMNGIGGNFINLNVTGTLAGYDGICFQECVRGGTIYNMAGGANTSSQTDGYALHFIGHNNDIVIYAGNNGGGVSDLKIEDSAHGNTTNVVINGVTFQTATGPGIDIEGGSGDIMFENCRFNSNATHGGLMNGTGSKIKFHMCVWSSDGSFNSNGANAKIASGSNGGEISQIASWSSPSAGVLDLQGGGGASGTGNGNLFNPAGGTAYVAASGSTVAVITYTGTTATSLTGCAYVSGSATGTVSTNGCVSPGAAYDLDWSGAGTGDVVDCEFASSIETLGAAAGVQASVNIAAGQNVAFQNCRFTGSGASSSNWFTNLPAIATVSTATGQLELTGNVAAPAVISSPGFAVGAASQLSDTSQDYMVYLTIGTPGTGMTVAIGPTSTPAYTVHSSSTPTTAMQFSVRVPAGWYLEVAGTSTTIANQVAVAC